MEYEKLKQEWRKRRQEIKDKYAKGGVSIRDLAKEYNITDARIWSIIHTK